MRATDSSQLPQRHKPQTTTETGGGSLSRGIYSRWPHIPARLRERAAGFFAHNSFGRSRHFARFPTPSEGVDFVWLSEDVLFI